MKDGIDKGFCLSYWRLSYRRKFIWSLWSIAIGYPVLVALQVSGLFPEGLSSYGVPYPVQVGWGWIVFWFIVGGFAAWDSYYRWQAEKRNAIEATSMLRHVRCRRLIEVLPLAWPHGRLAVQNRRF